MHNRIKDHLLIIRPIPALLGKPREFGRAVYLYDTKELPL